MQNASGSIPTVICDCEMVTEMSEKQFEIYDFRSYNSSSSISVMYL